MRLAAFVVLALATPAHADLRFALGNDTFATTPKFDDDGFTNDVSLAFWRPRGPYLVGGAILDRWVTEVGGPRRWDQLELTGTVERTWGERHVRSFTAAARVGPAFGGDLGGRWGQNGFHTICRCGRLLDEGLQSMYPADRTFGAVIGGRGRGSIGTPNVQAYGVVDTQAAIGTGVTWIEASVGGRVATLVGHTELAAHFELVGARYHVNDPSLAIPGGYRPGFQGEWRVGAQVAWSRYHVEYEYRDNESGSGQPFGILGFTVEYRP
jgi:hypothetical protein